MNDQLRAAIIAAIQSLFPVLNILGIVNLTSDQISVLMLCITNFITLFFLAYKKGQSPG